MTRLRYKHCEGVLITDKMVAGKDLVDVMIMHHSPNGLPNAGIYKNGSDRAFKHIESDSLTKLKKVVKKELVKLGVQFNDEVRPRLKRR